MSRTLKILIVDDDREFAESNRDLLEAFGYEVHAAHTGAAGYELAQKLLPDLIILDVMMETETEGFEVARKVSETPALRNTAILLVTGIVGTMKLPAGLKPDATWLPVDRILDKPIDPDRLICEVERLLKQKGLKKD